MEIDKSIRSVSNLMKNFEKSKSCTLADITPRNSDAKKIVKTLAGDLRNGDYCSNPDGLRSLHFLFVLNMKSDLTEELECNSDIGHAIGVISQLSGFVYLALSVKLNLIKYMKEVIEYCPVKIVIHLLDSVNSNMKYLSPRNHFDVLASILGALFSRFRRSEEPSIPLCLYDLFQIFLLYYKEDEEATDFDSRSSSGYKWLSLIRLMNSISHLRFNSKVKTDHINLYDIEMPFALKMDETSKCEAMEEFYDRIFYKCRAFADILDMNLFMAWHEIEHEESTLQNIIGVEAYHLRATLDKCRKSDTLPAISSEMIDILSSVQRIPDCNTSVAEEKLDKDELEDRIKNEVEFDAKFITDAGILIREDSNALSFELAKKFISKLSSGHVNGVKEETIKNLIWMILQRMDLCQISSFVSEFINRHGIYNILYQSSVDLSSLIDQMNAINVDDEEKIAKILKEIMLFVFSSAPQVIAMLVKEGCSEQNKRSKIVDMLNTLKPICLYDVPDSSGPLLLETIKKFIESNFMNLTVTERHHFFDLVTSLSQKYLVQANAFLNSCLLPSLVVRESSNWQIISELLAFLKTFLSDHRDEVCFSVGKTLLQLLTVVDMARWNVVTFTPERVKACEGGNEVIDLIRELYLVTDHPADVVEMLTSNACRFSNLTRVYFTDMCPSLLNDSIEWKLLSLIREPLQQNIDSFIRNYEEKEATFTFRMGELLPRLTSKEMQSIVTHYGADNPKNLIFIFDLISDGIAFISHCAARYPKIPHVDTNVLFSCVGQSLNNFLVALQMNSKIFEINNQHFYFIKYVKRLAAVLRTFPSRMVRPYQFNLIKFVDDSLSKLRATNAGSEMTDSFVEEFNTNIRHLFVGFSLLETDNLKFLK